MSLLLGAPPRAPCTALQPHLPLLCSPQAGEEPPERRLSTHRLHRDLAFPPGSYLVYSFSQTKPPRLLGEGEAKGASALETDSKQGRVPHRVTEKPRGSGQARAESWRVPLWCKESVPQRAPAWVGHSAASHGLVCSSSTNRVVLVLWESAAQIQLTLQGWKIKWGLTKTLWMLQGMPRSSRVPYWPATSSLLFPSPWKNTHLVSPVSFLDNEMIVDEFWQAEDCAFPSGLHYTLQFWPFVLSALAHVSERDVSACVQQTAFSHLSQHSPGTLDGCTGCECLAATQLQWTSCRVPRWTLSGASVETGPCQCPCMVKHWLQGSHSKR